MPNRCQTDAKLMPNSCQTDATMNESVCQNMPLETDTETENDTETESVPENLSLEEPEKPFFADGHGSKNQKSSFGVTRMRRYKEYCPSCDRTKVENAGQCPACG